MWSNYKVGKSGFDAVLGSLERQIMSSVWRLGEATVNDVLDSLDQPASYETVKTVMARLVEKRLLVRELEGRAYVYKAAVSQSELATQVSRRTIDSLISGFGSIALAQFADVLRENPEQLKELRRLIETLPEEE